MVITLEQLQAKHNTLSQQYQDYLTNLINTDPQAVAYNGALQQLQLLIDELTPMAPIAENDDTAGQIIPVSADTATNDDTQDAPTSGIATNGEAPAEQ